MRIYTCLYFRNWRSRFVFFSRLLLRVWLFLVVIFCIIPIVMRQTNRVDRRLRLAWTILLFNYDLSISLAISWCFFFISLLCNAFNLVLRSTWCCILRGSALLDWLKCTILAMTKAWLLTHIILVMVAWWLVMWWLICHVDQGYHCIFVSRYRRYRSTRRFSFSSPKDPTYALAFTPG